MKAVKIILLIALALVALVLVLGLIAPKEANVERSIVIDAPQEVVFNTLNDLKTWDSWSPWKEKDPTVNTTYGETTVGVGGSASWVSEESGNGKMEIAESNAPDNLMVKLEFDGQGNADSGWTLEPAEGGTKASWSFHSEFPYPFNIMLLIQNIEGFIQSDYDQGLKLLKNKIESEYTPMSNQTIDGFEIQVVDLPLHHFLGIKETITMDKMQEGFGTNLPKVFQAATDNNLEMTGMPCGLYYSWDEANQQTELAYSVPLKEAANVDGFSSFEVPNSKALLIEYYGSYDKLGAAHGAIDKYIKEKGVEVDMPAIEEYVSDPQKEADPSKWLTRIYYPVKG